MESPRVIIASYLCLLSLMLGACTSNAEEKKENRPPNIIWLVAEDQSPDFFPMYGDSTISLPNIESLATDGVIFDNAFSPVPVCAPARSALITGMYPTTLGTHNMRTYKAWGNENEPTIKIPNYSPIAPDGVKMFTEYLRKEGYYCANGPKEDYNFAKTEGSWDESSKDRHWKNRKPDQPFFTVFNFGVCHESQIWKRRKDSLFVDPMEVPVPPYFPDTDVVRHDLAVNYSNLKRLDDQIGVVIQQLKEDGLYENSIIFFYGDHGGPFPRHKRALYDTGIKVPLTIKFPKNDNAGSRDDRLISFIDFAPTVLSLAEIEPPKVMQGKAQLGEFEVTKKPGYTFHSSDRFDELYDRLRAVRSKRYKYIKSFDTEISHAIPVSYREQMPMMNELRKLYAQGLLNDEQAFWLNDTKPEEELYDLKNDPYELNNLVGHQEFGDTLRVMRNVLKEWIDKTKDLGQFAETDLIEKWIPNGKQPQLPPLEMEENDKGIRLISKKADATIVWKHPKDTVWNIYDNLISKGVEFEAKAGRIGYQESELLIND
ncbi:sulfatase [Maribacter sp. HTCC2170]|uniref:sulfatase family protein n=1 Tax=Maribacter sp. (strain HTCC2170 / KCCM 42371) TaxID=313603 RepID=UPI00006B4776|nr:sulfatase [Maribacter sp. HTCC2170]EAR01797.1 sulfatase family protein [Maribacter sp. HTCC2170]